MNLKKILVYLGILILVSMLVLVIYMYPFYHFFFTPETYAIDKDLTMLSGAGNSTILETDSAVVVIDTKMGSMAKKLHKLALEKAGNKKIIVINTHFHGDHISGNREFKGCPIYMGAYSPEFIRKNIKPEEMPTNFVKDSLILKLGNEILTMYNLGQGHTFDDVVVYLQNHKTLITGDLVFNKINPVLMKEDGTDLNKWKSILEMLGTRWDCKTVIPGHGAPGGKEMIVALKTYFNAMELAAVDPDKRWEIKTRYADWRKMPMMASPSKTIEFIRGK